jgi:hypothetical protein
MNLLTRIVLIMTVAITLLVHLTDGMHPLLALADAWRVDIGLGMGLAAMLAATAALAIGTFRVVASTARTSSYAQPGKADSHLEGGNPGSRGQRVGRHCKGMEIRHGHASNVRTRAECSRPTGWCSVAYFLLDGEPARMICQALEPYSRSPLPPPFSEGDELIIAGKMDRTSGRFNAICSRLVRQRETIDHNPVSVMVVSGLTLMGFGFYPVIIIATTLAKFPIDKIGPLVVTDSGTALLAVAMSSVGVLGLFMLVLASRLPWLRRMVDAAAIEANILQKV